MTGVRYCTREQVSAALGDSARSSSVIDRATLAASRSVDHLTHRRFYPELDTRYFDWPSPDRQDADSWRLWLDDNELISLTTLTSGGSAVTPADVLLEPNTSGPPFSSITLSQATSAAFSSGSTFQRSIAVTGLFGHGDDQAPAGALAAAVTLTSVTSIQVTDGSLVGVGDVLTIDTERLLVTERGWVTTAQTLQTPLTAAASGTSVAVTTGSAYAAGEMLLLDSERMLITDVAGNTLTVKRAQQGSVLAPHTGSTIYASRVLTVTRGALGSTAATHLISAPVTKLQVHPLVNAYALALAINQVLQETGGYSQATGTSGSTKTPAPGAGLDSLRKQVYDGLARKARSRSI